MNIYVGKILLSAPSLADPNFDKVVILITEHNEKGALGFVMNKLFSRLFNELVEFNNCKAFPLFDGGPVEKEKLFFLHRRSDLIEGGIRIADNIYTGGNFNQAVQFINNNTINEDDIKLSIGYCGWDYGQLEEEIAEGSWIVSNTHSSIIFTTPIELLLNEIYMQENN